MAIQKFEDIIAWQKAQDLAVDIYAVFKSSKDYGFKDQICRAVVSVSNNIAEGFDRSSYADFKRFLYISIASCSEVKSMLHLAEKLIYISVEQKGKSFKKRRRSIKNNPWPNQITNLKNLPLKPYA